MNMFGAIMWELFIEHGWMGTDEVVDLSGVSRHFGKFKKYRKP